MNILIHWFISAIAILLAAYFLSGVKVSGLAAALVTALVLGLANAFLRPFLLIITLPITVITLGLFALVINTLMIMLTSALVPGFEVRNFWWALLFSIILAVINAILDRLVFGTEVATMI